jgi:trk system potassium uptake protein TrkA
MEFAVIGLGAFGRHVALNLQRLGNDVLAIDNDETLVNSLADQLATIVRADATDEAAMRELHLERMPCAVVAIGMESTEASILATTVLRQIGVPKIVARSVSTLHSRVLRAVGAHVVARPEQEMGERLALRLSQPNVLERVALGANAELVEVHAPAEFASKTLVDLDVRRKHGVTVVAVRRGEKVLAAVEGSERILPGDILVVIGTPQAVKRLAARV